ncbi:hypothetical protein B0A49_02091 [Cryomyces minteri]|uniref:Uncharacterized protein n=1 Tax=Cryomyces minteri TaxID=331657 RepID=A0A4U0XNM7_9PEZI|nr:hypothetical protein B0A49_02091 [Cryomyces minteri]
MQNFTSPKPLHYTKFGYGEAYISRESGPEEREVAVHVLCKAFCWFFECELSMTKSAFERRILRINDRWRFNYDRAGSLRGSDQDRGSDKGDRQLLMRWLLSAQTLEDREVSTLERLIGQLSFKPEWEQPYKSLATYFDAKQILSSDGEHVAAPNFTEEVLSGPKDYFPDSEETGTSEQRIYSTDAGVTSAKTPCDIAVRPAQVVNSQRTNHIPEGDTSIATPDGNHTISKTSDASSETASATSPDDPHGGARDTDGEDSDDAFLDADEGLTSHRQGRLRAAARGDHQMRNSDLEAAGRRHSHAPLAIRSPGGKAVRRRMTYTWRARPAAPSFLLLLLLLLLRASDERRVPDLSRRDTAHSPTPLPTIPHTNPKRFASALVPPPHPRPGPAKRTPGLAPTIIEAARSLARHGGGGGG